MALKLTVSIVDTLFETIPANTKVALFTLEGATNPTYTMHSDLYTINAAEKAVYNKTAIDSTTLRPINFTVVDGAASVNSGLLYPKVVSRFLKFFERTNVTYKITKDYSLNNAILQIPSGCTLDFHGGSFSTGTLIGNNTKIKADLSAIFDPNLIVEGTWVVKEGYPEWFGAKPNDPTFSNTLPFQKAMSVFKTVKVNSGTYYISSTLTIDRAGLTLVGDGKFNSILRATDNFWGTSFIRMDGSSTPAYRSMQLLKGLSIRGTGMDTTTFGVDVNKNANFLISDVLITFFGIGINLTDTLLYQVEKFYISNCDLGIAFRGRATLSGNNSVSFTDGVITICNAAMTSGLAAIGAGMVFKGIEFEYIGHSRAADDVRPMIRLYSGGNGYPFVSFINNWFENNPIATTIYMKLGQENTVNFDGNTVLDSANTVDSFLVAEANETGGGTNSVITIQNMLNPTQYRANGIVIKDNISLNSLVYQLTMEVANLDQSLIRKGPNFITDLRFANGKGLKMRGLGGTVDSRVYVEGNHLNIESGDYLNFMSTKWFGSSTATDYTKPFRIGNKYLWVDSGYLRIKTDAPTKANDGFIAASTLLTAGTTAERPITKPVGFIYFDTTLGKCIVWNGVAWINMDGTAIA